MIVQILVGSFMVIVIGLFIVWIIYNKQLEKTEEEEKQKKRDKLVKEAGKLQIVEKFDDDGKEYYIVEKSIYANWNQKLEWISFLYTKEEIKDEYDWAGNLLTLRTPIRFDTIEEAQKAAIEKEEELKRKKKAETYRKVIGEFRA